MIRQTKKIKEIYENIQKKLFYMIPEKWENLYLYASIIDKPKEQSTGELFFYYVPKSILKKNQTILNLTMLLFCLNHIYG